VVGFSRFNKSSDAAILSTFTGECAGQVKDHQYLRRLSNYFHVLRLLRRERPAFLWARGTDMMLVAVLYRVFLRRKVVILAEISDVYATSYAKWYSGFFRFLERRLYNMSGWVFATSPAFFEFYKIRHAKRLLWENFFPFSYSKSSLQHAVLHKLALLDEKLLFNFNWSGYLRCRHSLEKLSEALAAHGVSARLHLHGYPNGGDVTAEWLQELMVMRRSILYHGAYHFPTDLPVIFEKAHFTIVSERGHHNLDSTLCLSNRIYESAAHYTPCVAVGPGAIGRYVHQMRIGIHFETWADFTEFLQKLTADTYKHLIDDMDFEGFARYKDESERRLFKLLQQLGS
jgi:hypothetical protein